ncbi:hypothetical protein PUR49_32510 [Streptomyces sp. BE147]|uniref:hypothetical protein n=1 Tax=Streptomyces sp. BE147 TaxID=3002524 RepID=UPI002E77FE8A|nr:hypothetical protein [Streptomyces sp. BE147]MEE1741195.1 hypothetical protein [Streptomyces sp. BE147]
MGFFGRFTSPLRHIDADPDELVVKAYRRLQEVPDYNGIWPAKNALASEATALIALAAYLREHRTS